MGFVDVLLGRPLASSEARAEQIGVAAGIPIFGLDALSSAAYGPEAALTLLIPLGAVGIAYIVPISGSIIILLTIVYFSYRQTIHAYPGGGGSYTVARRNLGARAGLLAASALLIDYILTAAVGISAGVGALVSALPKLQPHTLSICLGILLVITLINLRGVREAGLFFMAPTWLFVGTLFAAIAIGIFKTLSSGGHPVPVVAPPQIPMAIGAPTAWLLLQAFASGCTAMTGVEAVSNGVKAFRDPVVTTARRTLTIIVFLLILLLAGIAFLIRSYGIAATPPGEPGYQSVLSLLLAAVAGRNIFYYVSMGSILAVLALSANTAFADFPRLCRAIALNSYLPFSFALKGRRLVYSQGVYVLAALTALLLIIFRGVTDRLIPLYAVGAFLAFTLSQAGMVGHWKRVRGPGAKKSMFVNGLGAIATGITVVVVLVAKFTQGAWITVLLIPAMFFAMAAVRRYYHGVLVQTRALSPIDCHRAEPPLIILPVVRWNDVVKKALQFALSISPRIHAVHVESERGTAILCEEWERLVEQPMRAAGWPVPKLLILPSPYRFVVLPIVDHVREMEQNHPGEQIAVLIPELVQRRWYQYLLHNQRAALLKTLLLFQGNSRIVVMNVPWYLN